MERGGNGRERKGRNGKEWKGRKRNVEEDKRVEGTKGK